MMCGVLRTKDGSAVGFIEQRKEDVICKVRNLPYPRGDVRLRTESGDVTVHRIPFDGAQVRLKADGRIAGAWITAESGEILAACGSMPEECREERPQPSRLREQAAQCAEDVRKKAESREHAYTLPQRRWPPPPMGEGVYQSGRWLDEAGDAEDR